MEGTNTGPVRTLDEPEVIDAASSFIQSAGLADQTHSFRGASRRAVLPDGSALNFNVDGAPSGVFSFVLNVTLVPTSGKAPLRTGILVVYEDSGATFFQSSNDNPFIDIALAVSDAGDGVKVTVTNDSGEEAEVVLEAYAFGRGDYDRDASPPDQFVFSTVAP